MCGSTRYFRASTSSKYSFDPTGFVEWRMLQGRASQYCWTSAMDFSVELLTIRLPEIGRRDSSFRWPWERAAAGEPAISRHAYRAVKLIHRSPTS